jgi:hypothetical protein
MKRLCGMCLAEGQRVEAEFVGSDAGGLMWFECKKHDHFDNLAATKRVRRVPIRDFFDRIGIPYEEIPDLEEPAPLTERPPG